MKKKWFFFFFGNSWCWESNLRHFYPSVLFFLWHLTSYRVTSKKKTLQVGKEDYTATGPPGEDEHPVQLGLSPELFLKPQGFIFNKYVSANKGRSRTIHLVFHYLSGRRPKMTCMTWIMSSWETNEEVKKERKNERKKKQEEKKESTREKNNPVWILQSISVPFLTSLRTRPPLFKRPF